VLVRASGTEPLLRVMVEASSQAAVDHWTDQLAAIADRELNG
jgi:phosphoglucosamine mutase